MGNQFLMLAGCLLVGCASFTPVELSTTVQDRPVSMSKEINREYTAVRHFKAEQKTTLLFMQRMVLSGNPEVDEIIQREVNLSEGDAIVNLKVSGIANPGDVALPVAIGGLGAIAVSPFFVLVSFVPLFVDLKAYTIEGDVVKYVDKLPPVQQKPEMEKKKEPAGQKFDPITGLPIKKPAVRFDPETGLPIKPEN